MLKGRLGIALKVATSLRYDTLDNYYCVFLSGLLSSVMMKKRQRELLEAKRINGNCSMYCSNLWAITYVDNKIHDHDKRVSMVRQDQGGTTVRQRKDIQLHPLTGITSF